MWQTSKPTTDSQTDSAVYSGCVSKHLHENVCIYVFEGSIRKY